MGGSFLQVVTDPYFGTLMPLGAVRPIFYYSTYPDGPGQIRGYMSVQAEVTRALAKTEDFLDVLRERA